ncbi:tRNA dihydrouridine synthase [Aureococcus anophagefferens]|nr:tRNA dihydrouridine synthase [Aureococcus anophagefferens]
MASFDDSGAPRDGASSSAAPSYAYPFSVAPMMGVTDRHWRWMARQISWATTRARRPSRCNSGGNDARALGDAAALCVDYFGDSCVEINLNCGCPSNVVAARNEFGARLMLDPEKVRGIVHELIRRCPSTPVTVKHRLGTDLSGSDYATTLAFNRTIPPLKPDVAHMLARDLPDCTFAMNGMLRSLEDCAAHLSEWKGLPPVHSAMVGRAAWYQPWDLLATADTALYGAASDPAASRRDVLEAYLDYADERHAALDVAEDCLYRPLFYLFGGEQNSKKFRVRLADEVTRRARRTNRADAVAASSRRRTDRARAFAAPDDDIDALEFSTADSEFAGLRRTAFTVAGAAPLWLAFERLIQAPVSRDEAGLASVLGLLATMGVTRLYR